MKPSLTSPSSANTTFSAVSIGAARSSCSCSNRSIWPARFLYLEILFSAPFARLLADRAMVRLLRC